LCVIASGQKAWGRSSWFEGTGCGLSIFFEIKDLDRTNPVSDEGAADTAAATKEAGNESQIANFRFPSREPSRF
jgi:hypothetical protein